MKRSIVHFTSRLVTFHSCAAAHWAIIGGTPVGVGDADLDLVVERVRRQRVLVREPVLDLRARADVAEHVASRGSPRRAAGQASRTNSSAKATARFMPPPPARCEHRGRCPGCGAGARARSRSAARRRGRRCRASGSARAGRTGSARPARGPRGRGRAAPSARRASAAVSWPKMKRVPIRFSISPTSVSCCVARISVAFSARPSRFRRSISRRPSREASRNQASSKSTTLCTERSPATSRMA